MKLTTKILSAIAAVMMICPTGYAQKSKTQQDTIKVLGVGNSWTRDSMRWLCAIAKSAGVNMIVGHAYLGGSALHHQYCGIDDPTFTYPHSGKPQIVHNTYQYWKYTCSENAVKTPASGPYKNGSAGIGVTLEDVVKDEDWDYMIFQTEGRLASNFAAYTGKTYKDFDINKLVQRLKSMMAPEVAANIKVMLMTPFSYAQGNEDHRIHLVQEFAGGIAPKDQAGWDALYEQQHAAIQKLSPKLAEFMGGVPTINVGKAIHDARADKELSASGFHLQRSRDNTHLSEGMAMYIASLVYAYSILDIRRDDVTFYPSAKIDSTITPNAARKARKIAWKAARKN